jgi:threonine/homoserine/homoserine lactone efflux protein
MLSLPNLPLFLLASLLLLLSPGPAVMYIVARSIDQGRLAGFVSVLSIEVGNFVHVLAATSGLSAILVSSSTAFSIVKYLGAAYLVYLGVRRLLAPETGSTPAAVRRQNLGRIFRQGILVAVLNPKTAVFFFAFMPQFVDTSKNAATIQLLTLGCLFVFMAIVTDSLYAVSASTVGQWLKGNRLFLRADRYLVGAVYVGLGTLAAFADAKRH